jgi:flagellar biosynthesis/type III secretory pathway ATPase
MSAVVSQEHRRAAARMREVLATYEKNKDLILIGAYEKGSEPRVDYALRMLDRVHDFLKQETQERAAMADTADALRRLFANS